MARGGKVRKRRSKACQACGKVMATNGTAHVFGTMGGKKKNLVR